MGLKLVTFALAKLLGTCFGYHCGIPAPCLQEPVKDPAELKLMDAGWPPLRYFKQLRDQLKWELWWFGFRFLAASCLDPHPPHAAWGCSMGLFTLRLAMRWSIKGWKESSLCLLGPFAPFSVLPKSFTKPFEIHFMFQLH